MTEAALSDRLTIAGQPALDAFHTLRERGFTTLLNLRADGEDARQPGHTAESAAAGHAGLDYVFLPLPAATITQADVSAFDAALLRARGRVYAHCRSGERAFTLAQLADVMAGRKRVDEIAPLARRLGKDDAPALRWLARDAAQAPKVSGFFDARSSSMQYVVTDPATRHCAIIDPVYDFDETSGCTCTTCADAILAHIAAEGLTVDWILDTHPHADHFSAAHFLKQKTGAPIAIGANVIAVQELWKTLYHWPSFPVGGQYWDRLFEAGDTFTIGSLDARVMLSPGHTLASVTYVVEDAAFVHDTLFMPDSGTARADFPGGCGRSLWTSIQAILALPDDTRLFTGHDYQPGGRHLRWESSVAEQKDHNTHVAGANEAGFVAMREARDRSLPMPRLILHALQVNMRGGRLPEPEADGRRYLKFPLDALGRWRG